MKAQSLILMVVAAACGLVAMFGVRQVMNDQPENDGKTVTVLQAALDIQPGDLLNEGNVRPVKVNADAVPEGVVQDLKDLAERSLKVPAMPGDWILVSKLTEKGEIGAAANIPEGMRAVTIPVDATQTLSGMLRPGNRVDIMMTYDSRETGGGRGSIAKTILQYVEVFAVDDRIYGIDKTGDGSATAKNISVLVTPEQGNLLRLAEKVGRLSTSLRSNSDKTELATVEVTSEAFGRNSSENGNFDAASVMDSRLELMPDLALMGDTPPIPVADQLKAELQRDTKPDPGGSMPIIQLAQAEPKETWTIEIREGNKVRLEAVELPEASKPQSSFWDFFNSGSKTQTP